MSKIIKVVLSILVTKWIADVVTRAAHDPQIEKTVVDWSMTAYKKILMTVTGAVFFCSGLVLTIMSVGGQLDMGLPMVGYRTAFALFIFLAGCSLLIGVTYRKPKPVVHRREPDLLSSMISILAQGRKTRPQVIDARP